MDNVTLQSFGAAAGALMVVYMGFQNAPSFISAIRGTGGPPKEIEQPKETDTESKKTIDNNTLAITKLTQFLEKDAAVREVKDKQVVESIRSMDKKIDEIYDLVNTHSTKCDATCRGGN